MRKGPVLRGNTATPVFYARARVPARRSDVTGFQLPRLSRYLAQWVPSPPGKQTFQNCTIKHILNNCWQEKDWVPDGLSTRLAGATLYGSGGFRSAGARNATSPLKTSLALLLYNSYCYCYYYSYYCYCYNHCYYHQYSCYHYVGRHLAAKTSPASGRGSGQMMYIQLN